MSYQLQDTELEVNLTVRPSAQLHLHEHVIVDHVDRLLEAIDADGTLHDPIIVDQDTGVVLDGMHRLTVLKQLGFEAIPVCEIPYDDEHIGVGSWIKVYNRDAMETIESVAESLDIALEPIDALATQRTVERPLLIHGDARRCLDLDCANLDAYLPTMNRFFDTLLDHGLEPRLIADTAFESIDTEAEIAIMQPVVNKDLVREAATNGTLFPPNTSRHVIPSRPVDVDIPLALLEHPIDEADRLLEEHIARKTVRIVERGSMHDGRAYEEELVIFE